MFFGAVCILDMFVNTFILRDKCMPYMFYVTFMNDCLSVHDLSSELHVLSSNGGMMYASTYGLLLCI